jgi:hypothetical protein
MQEIWSPVRERRQNQMHHQRSSSHPIHLRPPIA